MDANERKLYQLRAEVIQAVGHPLRLAIIDFLKEDERCVCDIAAHVGAGRSNVSRHLGVLLKAGILDCRKDGLRVFYRLRTPCILEFFSCVGKVLRGQLERNRRVLARL